MSPNINDYDDEIQQILKQRFLIIFIYSDIIRLKLLSGSCIFFSFCEFSVLYTCFIFLPLTVKLRSFAHS